MRTYPSPLVREFMEKGRSTLCPVIDVHKHLEPFRGIYFPNSKPEDMIRTTDQCRVGSLDPGG